MAYDGDRIVLCMRWGTLYPARYVNLLYRATRAHLSGPFRFVCLTSDGEGFDPDIEQFPIPDLGYSEQHWRSGAWPKLSVFLKDLYGLTGRALFIDLDSVIVNDLDPFFDIEAPLHGIDTGPSWKRRPGRRRPTLGTGVFTYDIGSLSHVADRFREAPNPAFGEFLLEQCFVEYHVPGWQPWPDDWVISFKRHLCRPIGLDLTLAPRTPDVSTKIVAFHGDPRPADIAGRRKLWSQFPHSVRCPVDWLDDYWEKYGA